MPLLMAVYIFVLISVSAIKDDVDAEGIPYGEDCDPLESRDTEILRKIEHEIPFKQLFPEEPTIFTLAEEEWTKEMEDSYALQLLRKNRCNLAEGLECSLQHNMKNQDVSFHHHHAGDQKKHEGHQPLEQRKVEKESDAKVDAYSEIFPEWRCTCNLDTTVHNSVFMESPTATFVNDTCLVKVGFPCKYADTPKDSAGKQVQDMKTEYPCVQSASCIPLQIPTSNNSSGGSKEANIQMSIQKEIGYDLKFDGMRNAYLHYILRHLTHICKCNAGYKQNGNGICIPDTVDGRAELDSRDAENAAHKVQASLVVFFLLLPLW